MCRMWLVCLRKVGYCAAMTNRPGPFAQRIAAELRAELGRQEHSRRWLAEQIGTSHATVARWIGGDTDPPLDALEAMCRALGLSVADLLAAVQRNGGYEPTPLPVARAARGRRRAVVEGADNTPGTGGNTHRDADLLAAA